MSGQLVPTRLSLEASITLTEKRNVTAGLCIKRLKVQGVSSKSLERETQPRPSIS